MTHLHLGWDRCLTVFGPRFLLPIQSHSHPLTFTALSVPLTFSLTSRASSTTCRRLLKVLAMEGSKDGLVKEYPLGLDANTEEEFASQSKLLQEFGSISNIDKAWVFKSKSGTDSQVMFSISQLNLLANKRRKFILSSQLSKESGNSVKFQWTPFPVEMTGVSIVVPSPSGSKVMIVRNPENDSPTQIEIWGLSQLEKEFHVPQSVHGTIYVDGWFEGISWNFDETSIAYVAEEPSPNKPTFNMLGYKKGGGTDKDIGSWKGQGEWEEDWGETYAGKRQPALFVINVNSGEVRAVKGIDKSLSIGQVVWSPSNKGSDQYLIFVGWSSGLRKLGIKYCYNRPCALYAVRAPHYESETNEHTKDCSTEDVAVVNLTPSISSAFFPRVCPNGKFLVFLSARTSVDSGAHMATNSLHRIQWPEDGRLSSSVKIVDVIPVVMSAEDGCFPGLYCSNILSNPWLSDGCTMILSSYWGSRQVILSVNVISAEVLCISSKESDFSWSILTLDGDNIIAVSSSPVDVPQIKYGYLVDNATKDATWTWLNVLSPVFKCSEKVQSLLANLQFSIFKLPVKDVSDNLTKGASKPFEAIFVSSKANKRNDTCDPLIVILHGGPHSVSLTSFSKSLAFLSSIGYNLLIVNYRGSLGFGEEALQSLPGKVGSQDVNDVLTAIDHIIEVGYACPSKITVLGGSHGGFLATHLIGQAPDKFVAAAVRNPVCNLSSMVATTDIPDWCFVQTFGKVGKNCYTEAPSAEHLTVLHSKSPISHISKVLRFMKREASSVMWSETHESTIHGLT